MQRTDDASGRQDCLGFLALAGEAPWRDRMAEIARRAVPNSWCGRATQQRHALELILSKLAKPENGVAPNRAERRIIGLARDAVALADTLPEPPRERLRQRLLEGLVGEATLIPLFHLLREAARQRARGFTVHFTGLTDGTPHDLMLEYGEARAELVCETVSAEEGRHLNRGDWFTLVDGVNPELQNWLAAHPGRYLLKMTLPDGIQSPEELAALQQRVSTMLADQKRQDANGAAVLKLDPLLLAGVQAAGAGFSARLRSQFGPDAHLAVTSDATGSSVFVMAARAGRENAIAAAITRRLGNAAMSRLSGTCAGLVSVFLEDVDRSEWRGLRETLELEGSIRRFFTTPDAARITAASCVTRLEMFDCAPPDAAAQGEVRFRNQGHREAARPELQPAISSLA
ncbi:hypothetical protein [Teichococcus oryzae]|uniref:Uncharacterized protein n=1 Tax=Teichococcus oryzae TaxID=1608942 RepID=A0A5B2THX3_9PROT|nr:hypothetical protein [Pseudoroseomonas oryzae]KAA2214071.1 hypothetical protein F0Q34_08530 [Pseudoroseomonas oryzae]